MTDDLRALGDPGSEEFRVEAYPFYLLNRTVSRYNGVIERELRKIQIDIPTWRVLMILGEAAPRPIGQVAKAAVIPISTMMRIAERMTKLELIRSSANSQDGRVTDLDLTALGQAKLAEARQVTAPFYRRVIRGFSAQEFRVMLKLLDRLHDNLAE